MIDLRLPLMCGTDIAVPTCAITVHQPRIKEIAMIGEDIYFTGSQVLCIDKTQIIQDKTLLLSTDNFQIFMMVMTEKEAKDKRDAVMQVFQILFPQYMIYTTPRSLVLTPKEGEPITIDGNNFDDLQEVLKAIFCVSSDRNKEQTYNPANSKAQEIMNKIMKGRKKVADAKGTNNTSIFTQYLSVLTVALNISLLDLIELTPFQIFDLLERYSLWTSYDVDIKARLAGAKIEKQPENWMKDIH